MKKIENLIRYNILNLKPYIPGKHIEEVERELGIKNIIKLASNENPLGPSPLAISAIKKYLNKISLYPDGNCFLLKNKLSKKLMVKPENLIFGSGSDEIIHLIVLAFLNKGDEVITCHPSFLIYETNTILMNGRLKLLPLKNFTFDLEGISKAVTNKTKLIFIANPNNPTGTIVKKNEVKNFLKKLRDDIIVVFDEAYYEYVDSQDFPDTLKYIRQNKNLVVLRTFSKIYGLAGLRIGYGIAKPEIINYLNRVREPFNVNSVAQIAASTALGDIQFVKMSRRVNTDGKKFLYEEFNKLNIFYVPTQANFIFLDTNMDSQILFNKLLKEGIIVRTGDIFGKKNFIRLTIGKMEELKRFVKSFKSALHNIRGV